MLSYENVKPCLKLVVNSISPQNLVHCHHVQVCLHWIWNGFLFKLFNIWHELFSDVFF